MLIAAAVLTGSFATVETAAAAGPKLSKKTALKKTAKLARKVAMQEGASTYFAFGCKRKSRRVVNCIGGVGYENSVCLQRVRNRRKGGRVITRRFGPIECGDLPPEAGGGGGGGEGTAICAIRQSVCI